MTLNQAAEMYFDLKKGLIKPTSYSEFLRIYNKQIRDYIGEVDLETFGSRDLQKFYNSLVSRKSEQTGANGKTLSLHTAKDYVGLVKTICYFAMEEGEMPERRFKLKTPYGFRKHENNQDEYVREEFYEQLIKESSNFSVKNCIGVQAKVFVILAITTGMRIGEACGVKWEDVDFNNNTIKIQRTVGRIYDSENKNTYIHIGDPKSETSRRTVILTDVARQVLLKYQNLLEAQKKSCLPELFLLPNRHKPQEPRTMRQAYARYLERLNIPYIHPHALRHTFCTYAIDNGVPVKITSSLLGHANTSITLDTYTHTTEKQIKETTNLLNTITTAALERSVER